MEAPFRLMVTGAGGFVAGSVIRQAPASWEIHALSRGEPLWQRESLHWHRLEAVNSPHLAELFRQMRPQAVIHTAALADIDFCEANPKLATEVNVDFTARLTDLCGQHASRLVLCSTDTVFDGENAPYREEDPVGPINFYAETKVKAEQIVRQLASGGVVARLALVMGLPLLGAGNSFLPRFIGSLRAGREVQVAAHEARTPVDVVTLGQALLELAASSHSGVVHLGGNERLNRLELSQRIAAWLGLPVGLVKPGSRDLPNRRAPRPRDVSLVNAKARALLRTPMLDFDAALSLVLQGRPHAPR